MTKFSDLALDPRVLQAVSEAGYESPTPIQAQAIPHALEGKDVLGIAQTGTGKTASFTLPMITILSKGRARARMPRSLVLAPTRELAAQVAENFEIYAKHTKLTKALLIGGVAFGEQDKLIDRGVDVLIATPGRLLDHFERGKLLLQGVQIMVVDEADRMLDMGFIPDIERIFSLTPPTRQTFFYSATMAPEIERITKIFLSGAVKIEVARQATASETIEQALYRIKPARKDQSFADKRAALRALIRSEGDGCTNAIIFCNRKMDVDVVSKSLKQHGFNASPIHGDLDQSVRTRTLDGFRDGSVRLLVASDVAARGLDIPAVSHVFNFDVPTHPEDYIHRIGRTGRAGRLGKAFTIAVPADEKYIAAIESLIKQTIPMGPAPDGIGESVATAAPEERLDAASRPTRSRGGRGRSRSGDRAPVVEVTLDGATAVGAAPDTVATEAPPARTDRAEPSREGRKSASGRSARNGGGNEEAVESTGRGDSGGRGVGTAKSDVGGHGENARGTERRSDDKRERTGDRTVGMGDHMPDFLTRSFFVESLTGEDSVEDSDVSGS